MMWAWKTVCTGPTALGTTSSVRSPGPALGEQRPIPPVRSQPPRTHEAGFGGQLTTDA